MPEDEAESCETRNQAASRRLAESDDPCQRRDGGNTPALEGLRPECPRPLLHGLLLEHERVETSSVATSASAAPDASRSARGRRAVVISATGTSACPRAYARTSVASSAGTRRPARPSGKRISRREPASSGSFRCHPASPPPWRRRSVTPARTRRRSEVS